MNYQDREKLALNVRANILKMTNQAASGHPGGSLSAVELLITLYFHEMNINEENVDHVHRDKFVLSKGHASPVLYSVLAAKGFFPESELMKFRNLNANLQGHPNMRLVRGVDMSTGSLGQGLSVAVGMSLANKLDKNDFRTYVLCGDGESEEGQIWEAAMAAAHYKLDNLCAILDFNGLQIDGNVTDVMNPTPLDKKFEAFGWNVVDLENPYDYASIEDAFAKARACKGKPTMILAHTVKGKGISFMENQAGWHGVAPNAEQLKAALEELGVN